MPIIEAEGRRLPLTHLEKVLYPDTGSTKSEVLHYYATVARVMLPHLRDRPLSFLRYPDGADGETFFTKNVPPGTPDWVTVAEVPKSDGALTRRVLVQDLPSLVWAANLVVEFHTPQWTTAAPRTADRLILDLDPGPPADIVDCCRAALWLRDRLAADGLECRAKTAGSKGLHLMCAIEPVPAERSTAYARSLAIEAERALPDLVVRRMARELRAGKVFVDYSQNAAAKTTATPYTLRARRYPLVSTPVTWDEIAGCTEARQLEFRFEEVPARLRHHGDLLRPLCDPARARPLPRSA